MFYSVGKKEKKKEKRIKQMFDNRLLSLFEA